MIANKVKEKQKNDTKKRRKEEAFGERALSLNDSSQKSQMSISCPEEGVSKEAGREKEGTTTQLDDEEPPPLAIQSLFLDGVKIFNTKYTSFHPC